MTVEEQAEMLDKIINYWIVSIHPNAPYSVTIEPRLAKL
jgi:hypothetical protein